MWGSGHQSELVGAVCWWAVEPPTVGHNTSMQWDLLLGVNICVWFQGPGFDLLL